VSHGAKPVPSIPTVSQAQLLSHSVIAISFGYDNIEIPSHAPDSQIAKEFARVQRAFDPKTGQLVIVWDEEDLRKWLKRAPPEAGQYMRDGDKAAS
jgi:hypothetical protein